MVVNGKNVEIAVQMTIEEFLNSQNYNIKSVAVEKNGEIIPKACFCTDILNNNDELEIVCFVGGG